jgi:hypothetical protein
MSPPFSSDHGIRNEPADKVFVFKGVLLTKEHLSKKTRRLLTISVFRSLKTSINQGLSPQDYNASF